MTSDQMKAISRYAKENNLRLSLSSPPFININFQNKETGDIVTKKMSDLLYDHAVKAMEEKKSAAAEKKRVERENQWKPRIVS